jgi:peptidoglycan/xylan/chitin deacetylase (PgdA/CDA1 family)
VSPWILETPAAVAAATAGLAAYGAIHPRAQLFGSTICRTNRPNKLAITFDDGPNPAITPKLLDLLDRFQAKATFFVIGRYVRECPELVQETVARGHEVGNHTELHPNLLWLNSTNVHVELRLCHDAIRAAIGTPAKWFRPPFGMRNPWVVPAARELGYRTVMWTLIPGDWRAKSAEWLVERMNPIAERAKSGLLCMAEEKADPSPPFPRQHLVAANRGQARDRVRDDKAELAAVGEGDILCLHDGHHRDLNADRSRTLAALEHWLPRWRDLGLEFVTIGGAVSTPAL